MCNDFGCSMTSFFLQRITAWMSKVTNGELLKEAIIIAANVDSGKVPCHCQQSTALNEDSQWRFGLGVRVGWYSSILTAPLGTIWASAADLPIRHYYL